jgi:aryl-alcohol dehydrogenase-like predicted oxidoreductase
MEFRQLGRSGFRVPALAFGTATFGGANDFYRAWGNTDVAEAKRLVDICLDAGVNFLDTANSYSTGRAEEILGAAIAGRRHEIILATKATFPAGAGPNDVGSSRHSLLRACDASLRRLGTEYVDIYRPARLDPQVPIEDTIGTIAELVKQGNVRQIGLSEVGVETIRRAHKVHPIADLQIEYSLISRGPETRIFPLLSDLGIGVTAYCVLSRGLLSGSTPRVTGDFRRHLPRFSGSNLQQNTRLVDTLSRIASEKGVTPSQLAIAWVLAKGPGIVPLIGARTRAQLTESLAALNVALTAVEVERIEAALPPTAVAGTRYDEHQMRVLDSEREGASK